MNSLKIRKKNCKKTIIFKSSLIVVHLLSIYLTKLFKGVLTIQLYNSIYKKFIKDNFFLDENKNCDDYDPIFLMAERLKKIQLLFVIVKNQDIFVIKLLSIIIITIFQVKNME